ncbi:MAG: tryptophan 7-halogenase [Sphingomonas sp.]|uniref:tryptophan halogenase family protein n=1 Tax=Sphingomonas sp. TaxID=28214 RepID=UPI0025D9019C|nr:tryptophan halogenase family protein [Sphingomonas sp.]MBY0283087.1 tryptophan 7-halogenase [Sphingomonas sp.]
MTEGARRIVVLGGGTAGWMAANLFAHAWPRARVTVIESPDIGIIGVGEGSTPQLKAFFDRLGIAERDWMPACNATYKNGIAFHGWSERAGCESYFHPFPGALDVHTGESFFSHTVARRQGIAAEAHPDRFYLPARLAAEQRGPKPSENFPFEPSYGYHFDAYLVGAYLRDHATARGVVHLPLRVTEVRVGADGQVAALMTEDGQAIEADLFVDASGFRSVIAQEALGARFRSFADNLFNDSAVVMPTPRMGEAINAHTKATALSAGWCWDIPLTNRTGNGYVYSSLYLTPEQAEAELRAHLGLTDDAPAARHLKMKVGRVETSWTANCLAVGLSQGFIEPLEATALHIVQATVEGFINAWAAGGFTPRHRDKFNASIAARYDGIRDYIVCHYRVNQRTDTRYWRDNAANTHLSDSLKALLHCWYSGGDMVAEVARQRIEGYYSPMSWYCLLSGYGSYPPDAQLRVVDGGADMERIDDFMARCASNFAPHHQQLAALGAPHS